MSPKALFKSPLIRSAQLISMVNFAIVKPKLAAYVNLQFQFENGYNRPDCSASLSSTTTTTTLYAT